MKIKQYFKLLAIVWVLLGSSCNQCPSYSDLEEQKQELLETISELENELEDLQNQYRNLQYEYEEVEGERDDLVDIIERAKQACLIWDGDTFMIFSILNAY